MSRGIVYYVWGNYNTPVFKRAIKSAEEFGYDYTIVEDKTKYKNFRKRIELFDNCPYDTTLYLDADTKICDNIDFGFDMADKYGLACAIAPASMAFPFIKDKTLIKQFNRNTPQYNCGALFFNKTKTEPTFRLWEDLMRKYPESYENDQPYFAHAVIQTINPYVLPKNWNYRPHLKFHGELYGKLKILHSGLEYNEKI